ncbi:hypothetical protein ACVFI8_08550 [Agarivorans sp. MS3-6]|uniref:hypothetical protein n=1 Tax=Agarivorans sp. TSD2052 TaxID=2937286 RepID=UPI00200DFE4B|nr:hypothetical protein [Agarivorans sp. TSD2052]UPW18963.1 hypothetical protein M0C34_01415 [Agarivorans sp. TSD2052]
MTIAQNDRKSWPSCKPITQGLSEQVLKELILGDETLDYGSWLHCLGAEKLVDAQEYPSTSQAHMISDALA